MKQWILIGLESLFVSEDIPNHQDVETLLEKKAEKLKEEAQQKFTDILDGMGLKQVMGVIIQKGVIK